MADEATGGARRGLAALGGVLLIVLGAVLELVALAGTALSTSTAQDVLVGAYAALGIVGIVMGVLLLAAARAAEPVATVARRRSRPLRIALVVALIVGLLVLTIALGYEPAPVAPVG